MRFHCLLFDLDGTLVDSSEDLFKSVNLTLVESGGRPLAGDTITCGRP
jgi:phosphoglycolate phosphatase-like HAD superfamily hydrolase